LTLYVTCVVFLQSGLSPFSLNPSISIWVYKTVVIQGIVRKWVMVVNDSNQGSLLLESPAPADLRKFEHSHRFCLKHMQGLSRRSRQLWSCTTSHLILQCNRRLPQRAMGNNHWNTRSQCFQPYALLWLINSV